MAKLLIIWKLIKKYWWVLLVVVFIIMTVLIKHYKGKAEYEAARADRWKSNHDELRLDYKQTKDKLGRTETRVKEYKITIDELQSDFYRKNNSLKTLRKELRMSEVTISNLQKALKMKLESSNKGETVIRDTILEKKEPRRNFDYLEVDDGFLDFEAYWMEKDSVDWFYNYTETIYYWTEMKPTLYNDKGNKRFFLWRWIWPQKHPVTKTKSINPNSTIKGKKYKIVD
ncbi:MAG: hypothetical protein K9J21_07090 [Bacteroidales bacterium]|nr:hypothetical protein [Bacteroidales bacterium]